ncbi:hypothetical protein [Kibdelosporangium persicum]|uniref:hypothetical protein n=1 Tax=Kibdelosporangium persicum TaxID=2698649 RepID=UPI0015674451|nr:hypothetical protein [Kibdelosporangium persicum]
MPYWADTDSKIRQGASPEFGISAYEEEWSGSEAALAGMRPSDKADLKFRDQDRTAMDVPGREANNGAVIGANDVVSS